jgi:BolA protein
LTDALAPSRIDGRSIGAPRRHAGSRPQESHFRLTLVAHAFEGRSRVERQRMVFDALWDLMRTDIHALAITALTPAEAAATLKRKAPK